MQSQEPPHLWLLLALQDHPIEMTTSRLGLSLHKKVHKNPQGYMSSEFTFFSHIPIKKSSRPFIMIPTTNSFMIPTQPVGLPNRNANCNLKLMDDSSKNRLQVRFAHQELMTECFLWIEMIPHFVQPMLGWCLNLVVGGWFTIFLSKETKETIPVGTEMPWKCHD